MSSTPKPARRRWRQFSLRSLLLLMLVVALACGWIANEHRKIRADNVGVEYVTKRQGELLKTQADSYMEAGDKPFIASPKPWWLYWTGAPTGIVATDISFDLRYTDDGLELPTNISDSDLLKLSSCTELESLRIPRSQITDAGLAHLSRMKKLRTLDLSQTKITDAGLAHLSKLPQLEGLLLNGVSLDGSGLRHLRDCPNLQILQLNQVRLRNEHAIHLNSLSHLTDFSLDNDTLTELHLKKMPFLHDCKIALSAADVDLRLEDLPQLKQVSISASHPLLRRLTLRQLPKLYGLYIYLPDTAPEDVVAPDVTFEGLPDLRGATVYNDHTGAVTRALSTVKSIYKLILYGKQTLGDAEAERLSRLEQLNALDISSPTDITNNGVRSLANLKNMDQLALSSPYITASGLRELGKLPRLTSLSVTGMREGGDMVSVVKEMTALRHFHLQECEIEDFKLRGDQAQTCQIMRIGITKCSLATLDLADLPNLESLSVECPLVKHLRLERLPKLQRLDISLAEKQVMDSFALGDLPNLTWLSLQCGPTGAKVPATIFSRMSECPKLKDGIIWGLDMPDAAKEDLLRWQKATGAQLYR